MVSAKSFFAGSVRRKLFASIGHVLCVAQDSYDHVKEGDTLFDTMVKRASHREQGEDGSGSRAPLSEIEGNKLVALWKKVCCLYTAVFFRA